MLLVKKFSNTIKEKGFLVFFYFISIVFFVSSYQLGVFSENGVSSGFTPFFVSIILFVSTTVLLFKEHKINNTELKIPLFVVVSFICFWAFLYINPFLFCFSIGIFSFLTSKQTPVKKIVNSSIVVIVCLAITIAMKFLGIEIG